MNWQYVIEILLIVGAPFGLVLASVWAVQDFRRDRSSWRNRISLVAVGLIVVVVILWPIMAVFAPGGAYSTEWWDRATMYIETWRKIVFKICALGLLASLFGRPRTIVPIIVAAIGVALFWLFTTAL